MNKPTRRPSGLLVQRMCSSASHARFTASASATTFTSGAPQSGATHSWSASTVRGVSASRCMKRGCARTRRCSQRWMSCVGWCSDAGARRALATAMCWCTWRTRTRESASAGWRSPRRGVPARRRGTGRDRSRTPPSATYRRWSAAPIATATASRSARSTDALPASAGSSGSSTASAAAGARREQSPGPVVMLRLSDRFPRFAIWHRFAARPYVAPARRFGAAEALRAAADRLAFGENRSTRRSNALRPSKTMRRRRAPLRPHSTRLPRMRALPSSCHPARRSTRRRASQRCRHRVVAAQAMSHHGTALSPAAGSRE